MRPSIQNMRKLLNRRTMTLLAVCLLLLAAVAANVIMNRNEEKAAKAATAAVSVPAPGAQGSFFDMYRSERDSVRTQELAYLDAIVAQGGDEATLSEAQKQKMTEGPGENRDVAGSTRSRCRCGGFYRDAGRIHEFQR